MWGLVKHCQSVCCIECSFDPLGSVRAAECFGISVTGLTHQKQCQGLQQHHTVSTAPFMFCSGSLQFHISQQQVRRKKIMGPTCCYQAFPQLQWNMSNSVCLIKDRGSTGSSQETISDCVTWPRCKGAFRSDIQAEIIAASLHDLTFHDANL